MRKYRLSTEYEATQVQETDFEGAPNDNHVAKVTYDPVRQLAIVPVRESWYGAVAAVPGNWIVQDSSGGLKVFTDEAFRFSFVEVTDADS